MGGWRGGRCHAIPCGETLGGQMSITMFCRQQLVFHTPSCELTFREMGWSVECHWVRIVNCVQLLLRHSSWAFPLHTSVGSEHCLFLSSIFGIPFWSLFWCWRNTSWLIDFLILFRGDVLITWIRVVQQGCSFKCHEPGTNWCHHMSVGTSPKTIPVNQSFIRRTYFVTSCLSFRSLENTPAGPPCQCSSRLVQGPKSYHSCSCHGSDGTRFLP